MKESIASSELALNGGVPVLSSPGPHRKIRWGASEKALLDEMLEQRSLFYWKGPQTELLVKRFKANYPFEYIMPCSSGTAALHIAIAAAGIKPGEEVIVPPITDMGTVIGILYQLGVPVFADVEPHTYNIDPVDVRRKITDKTRAIIAVHLAGNPCRILELRKLADEFNLVLIEDCAQAWGARRDHKPVGMYGHIGCYSLNDFKHLSCGDGGIVGSSDSRFGPLLQRFGDKAYDRVNGIRNPAFLAPNYRISEPQSAVAAGQLERLESITNRRNEIGTLLSNHLANIRGIHPHQIDTDVFCSYWFYLLCVDEKIVCDRDQFATALRAEGVGVKAGYIPMPLYRYEVFQTQNFFGGEWPVREMGLTQMDYKTICCPNAEAILDSCIYIEIHEGMDDIYIEGVARAIHKVAEYYRIQNK